MATRTIVNPATNSGIVSSVVRTELQTLENEITTGTDPGHLHTVASLTATGTPSSTTYLRGDGTWSVPAGGTVTAVSIATANGFSGSSSGGATPALTIIAGAITPTSVNGITFSTSTGTFTLTNSKTFSVTNSLTLSGSDGTTMTFPSVGATIGGLNISQTWTGNQTFTSLAVRLLGASTGYTTFTSANAGASNFTLTFPAITDTLVTLTGVQTMTNTFITPQVQSVADAGGTFTPVSLTNDVGVMTALSQATTIAAPTGSPVQGEKLLLRLKDNGTARALTWNAIFRASTDLALPATTILSKTLYCGFFYNSTDSKWDLVALLNNF